MADKIKKLVAGNWKMNGSKIFSETLIQEIGSMADDVDVLVCPPFPYLSVVAPQCLERGIALGAQDCSVHESGAYTGEVSAQMLKDIGCSYVILGHSERREYHKESNELIKNKVSAAHKAGLIAILCIGETEAQREMNQEQTVVRQQLDECLPDSSNAQNTVIAYEPVWAIGTGKTASADDAEKMHEFIGGLVSQGTRILYGGSMKPSNAEGLLAMPSIHGGLIGGASLKAEDFIALAQAARIG